MSNKRAPGRSLDEWMELVTECRQSGLTDAAWCNEHGISPSCFYNAVTRLRKKACQIPEPVGKASTLDLSSHKQDVVQIAIEPESSPAGLIPDNGNRSMHLGKRQTMHLTLNETPLFYERRGFLHSSGSSDDQGIRSSNSAGSIFPCLSQRFGSSVRIYLK